MTGRIVSFIKLFHNIITWADAGNKKKNLNIFRAPESNECYFTLMSSAITAGWGNGGRKALRGLGEAFFFFFACIHLL